MWLPEAHALEGTRIPLRGAAGPVRSKSLSQLHYPLPESCLCFFSRWAVRFVWSPTPGRAWRFLRCEPPEQTATPNQNPRPWPSGRSLLLCGHPRRHQPVAPWPLLALPLWPLRSAPPTLGSVTGEGMMIWWLGQLGRNLQKVSPPHPFFQRAPLRRPRLARRGRALCETANVRRTSVPSDSSCVGAGFERE